MPASRSKAPPGTFWRGNTLHGRTRIKGGKLVTWSLETDNPRIAAQRRKAGKERLVAIRHGDATKTFLEVFEDWSRWIKKQVGPRTVERYACSIGQLLPWLDGKDQLEIDNKLIATIIAERGEQVCNATLKRDLGALSSVLNYCIDRGWREDNPVLPRLRRVKERRDPIVLPQIEHVNVAISRAPGMIGHLMRAAMVTGARQSELRLAERRFLDLDAGQLTVIGKGNKLRVIDLAPYDGAAFFASLPACSEAQERYLFWHDDGQCYGEDFKSNFKKFLGRVSAWAKREGVEFRPFAFHHLRHWHAVRFLKDGHGDIYALKERLGHTSLTTTEGYLQYLTPDEQRRAKYGGMAKGIAAPRSVAIPEREKPLFHGHKL